MTAKEKDLLDSSINRSYIIKGVSLLVGTLIFIATGSMTFYFKELVRKLDTNIELQAKANLEIQSIKKDVDTIKGFIEKQEPINKEFSTAITIIQTTLALRDNTSTKKPYHGPRE